MKRCIEVLFLALSLWLLAIVMVSADPGVTCDMADPKWDVHLYSKHKAGGKCSEDDPCSISAGRAEARNLAQNQLVDVCLKKTWPNQVAFEGFPSRIGAPVATAVIAAGGMLLALMTVGVVFWFLRRQRLRSAG